MHGRKCFGVPRALKCADAWWLGVKTSWVEVNNEFKRGCEQSKRSFTPTLGGKNKNFRIRGQSAIIARKPTPFALEERCLRRNAA
jgi:hypothetical protein